MTPPPNRVQTRGDSPLTAQVHTGFKTASSSRSSEISERGQMPNRTAQTDVGQADLKDAQVDERDPLTCRCGGHWQCKRRCTKTRERVTRNNSSNGGVAVRVGAADFPECQQRECPRQP
jgi:hypothetical protein